MVSCVQFCADHAFVTSFKVSEKVHTSFESGDKNLLRHNIVPPASLFSSDNCVTFQSSDPEPRARSCDQGSTMLSTLESGDTNSPNKSLLQEPDCQGDALVFCIARSAFLHCAFCSFGDLAFHTMWISWRMRELIVDTPEGKMSPRRISSCCSRVLPTFFAGVNCRCGHRPGFLRTVRGKRLVISASSDVPV